MSRSAEALGAGGRWVAKKVSFSNSPEEHPERRVEIAAHFSIRVHGRDGEKSEETRILEFGDGFR